MPNSSLEQSFNDYIEYSENSQQSASCCLLLRWQHGYFAKIDEILYPRFAG